MGTINGTVTGPDGRPLPSATVTVIGAGGKTVSVMTGPDGTFAVVNVPPGTYEVDVSMDGFKSMTQQNVLVAADTPVSLKIGMEQGSSVDKVQVQGTAPMVSAENSTISATYSGVSLRQLPVLDRNQQQFVDQMPGVTPPTPFVITDVAPNIDVLPDMQPSATLLDPQLNRIWATNGQLEIAQNRLEDGVENFEPFNGITVHIPTINDIQEMKIETNNYRPEEGRSLGSVTQEVTRTGANAFHGELFWFNSNNWFNARNYFNPIPLAHSPFNSNTFGAAAGTPIRKNKSFLFLSYQGNYLRSRTPTFTTVPTPAFAAGDFSALTNTTVVSPFLGVPFPGNTIPAALIDPRSAALLAALPAPNLPGSQFNFYQNVPFLNDGNRGDIRWDNRFSDKTSMQMRYGISYYNTQQDAVIPGLSADGGTSRLRAHDAMWAIDHVFGTGTIGTLRLGFTRYSDPINPLSSPFTAGSFGFTGNNGQVPFISVAGLPPLGTNPIYRQVNKENNYSLRTPWSVQSGRHTISFGYEMWWNRIDGFQYPAFGAAGGFTFEPAATTPTGSTLFTPYPNALAAFLLGAPTTAGITTSLFLPSYQTWQIAGYLADKIKFSRRATIDLGVRYDYFNPVHPRNNSQNYSIFNPTTNLFVSGGGIQDHRWNVAPRIGIALTPDDRTAVRFGYGISYWNPIRFEASVLTPAFTAFGAGVSGTSAVLPGTFGTFAGLGAQNVPVFSSGGSFPTPYVHFFNFTVQRDLTHGVLFDAGYVGQLGRHIPYTQDINAAPPGTGVAGLPFLFTGGMPIFQRGTGYTNNYNALQVQFRKRFSSDLAFNVAYTFSKALDFGAGLTPFLNNINPRANYGPADFDQQHILTVTHNFRLPVGTGAKYLNTGWVGRVLGPWEFDGIFTYGSGLPFTPIASTAICGCPGNTPTASAVAGAGVPTAASGYPAGYFNSFFFTFPTLRPSVPIVQQPAGLFGNLGRNSVRAPSQFVYNLAVSRLFPITERARLDVRAEAYNLTNNTNFSRPIGDVNSAVFGSALSQPFGSEQRRLQLALRLVF